MNPAYIAPMLFAAGVACLAFAAVSKPARGAERTPVWTVWNETTDRPWITAKGNMATNSSPTACSLAIVEATRDLPSGTRISCRRIAR
jgi:hypothetical protein